MVTADDIKRSKRELYYLKILQNNQWDGHDEQDDDEGWDDEDRTSDDEDRISLFLCPTTRCPPMRYDVLRNRPEESPNVDMCLSPNGSSMPCFRFS